MLINFLIFLKKESTQRILNSLNWPVIYKFYATPYEFIYYTTNQKTSYKNMNKC